MASEAKHQAAIFKWSQQPKIRQRWPELALLHHIPNGGRRDPIEAKHLQLQGVKKGVPDLHLPVAKRGYHSLYIELKNEKGRASEDQKWWAERLKAQGNEWRLCRGWEDAVNTLMWYLGGEDDNAS